MEFRSQNTSIEHNKHIFNIIYWVSDRIQKFVLNGYLNKLLLLVKVQYINKNNNFDQAFDVNSIKHNQLIYAV